MSSAMDPVTIEVDQRGRTSLGRILEPGTYQARRASSGEVVLERAHVITESDLAILRNAQVSSAIDQVLAGDVIGTPVTWR